MNILLIDDHPVLSLGLSMGLERRGMTASTLEPDCPESLTRQVAELDPTLIVMDLAMPQIPDTSELVASFASYCPVVMLSGSEDRFLLGRCLVAGAIGVLSKSEPIEVIIDEIVSVATGGSLRIRARVDLITEYETACREREQRRSVFAELTPAEREVLTLLSEGLPAARIAEQRFVSLPTIRTQIKSLLGKLGVTSQLEAAAMAHRMEFTS